MTPWRALPIGLAGLAVAALAEHYSARAHAPENHWLDGAVGIAYLVTGLIAWTRRPDNRIGPLMTAFAFVWFVGNYGNSHQPVLISLANGFNGLNAGILAQLVLAYPTGRLSGRSERIVVASLYAWLIAYGVAISLTYDPRTVYHCAICPSAGLAAFPSRSAFLHVTRAGDFASVIFAGAVILLLLRRFVTATPVARRALAPLWIAAVLVGVTYVIQGASGSHEAGATQKIAQILVPVVFLIGLLRSRLAESAIGPLLVAVSNPLQPGELRAHLAQALGDPGLRLAFPAGGGQLVGEDGKAMKGDAGTVTTFVSDGAALVHDPALLDRKALIDAVAAAARLALENERLQAEVRAQLEDVRASRARVVEAADAERKRVERNLHDGAQQRLVTLALELSLARERAARGSDIALRDVLDEASAEVAQAIAELRELAHGLHPAILREAGLGPALQSLADRSPVPTRLETGLNGRLPEAVEAGAYFLTSEALANVAKHASATRVDVSAMVADSVLRVAIEDDGIGGAVASAGSGLAALADRVAALGGRLEVDSPPNGGTRIRAELPCA